MQDSNSKMNNFRLGWMRAFALVFSFHQMIYYFFWLVAMLLWYFILGEKLGERCDEPFLTNLKIFGTMAVVGFDITCPLVAATLIFHKIRTNMGLGKIKKYNYCLLAIKLSFFIVLGAKYLTELKDEPKKPEPESLPEAAAEVALTCMKTIATGIVDTLDTVAKPMATAMTPCNNSSANIQLDFPIPNFSFWLALDFVTTFVYFVFLRYYIKWTNIFQQQWDLPYQHSSQDKSDLKLSAPLNSVNNNNVGKNGNDVTNIIIKADEFKILP